MTPTVSIGKADIVDFPQAFDPAICVAVVVNVTSHHALLQGQRHWPEAEVNRSKISPPGPLRERRVGKFPVAPAPDGRYRRRVQTLDPITPTPSGGLSSPAVARNVGPILAVLKAHLPTSGRVLEVAAGSGEHAVAFARALPGLDWTPADPSPEARASIRAWADAAGLSNLRPPLALDAADPTTWPEDPVDAVVCINMVHISPWTATEGLMAGAGRLLASPGGLLALYGPYRESEAALAPSNAAFDESLRARDPAWGLRDREAVVAEARARGLQLTLRLAMPANNLMLLFRRA